MAFLTGGVGGVFHTVWIVAKHEALRNHVRAERDAHGIGTSVWTFTRGVSAPQRNPAQIAIGPVGAQAKVRACEHAILKPNVGHPEPGRFPFAATGQDQSPRSGMVPA